MHKENSNSAKELKYWAFISYSHEDVSVARTIHRRLEKTKISRNVLEKTSQPALIMARNVFIDYFDLPKNGKDLQENLKKPLSQSQYLVVLCSPASAKPESNVGFEIREFIEKRGVEFVVPVIIAGSPSNPESFCFPKELTRNYNTGLLNKNPLCPDFRPPKGIKNNQEWNNFLASLLNVDKTLLFDERKKSQKKRSFFRYFAASTLICIFVLLTAFIYMLDRSTRIEISRKLALQSEVYGEKGDVKASLISALGSWPMDSYERERQSNYARFRLSQELSRSKRVATLTPPYEVLPYPGSHFTEPLRYSYDLSFFPPVLIDRKNSYLPIITLLDAEPSQAPRIRIESHQGSGIFTNVVMDGLRIDPAGGGTTAFYVAYPETTIIPAERSNQINPVTSNSSGSFISINATSTISQYVGDTLYYTRQPDGKYLELANAPLTIEDSLAYPIFIAGSELVAFIDDAIRFYNPATNIISPPLRRPDSCRRISAAEELFFSNFNAISHRLVITKTASPTIILAMALGGGFAVYDLSAEKVLHSGCTFETQTGIAYDPKNDILVGWGGAPGIQVYEVSSNYPHSPVWRRLYGTDQQSYEFLEFNEEGMLQSWTSSIGSGEVVIYDFRKRVYYFQIYPDWFPPVSAENLDLIPWGGRLVSQNDPVFDNSPLRPHLNSSVVYLIDGNEKLTTDGEEVFSIGSGEILYTLYPNNYQMPFPKFLPNDLIGNKESYILHLDNDRWDTYGESRWEPSTGVTITHALTGIDIQHIEFPTQFWGADDRDIELLLAGHQLYAIFHWGTGDRTVVFNLDKLDLRTPIEHICEQFQTYSYHNPQPNQPPLNDSYLAACLSESE